MLLTQILPSFAFASVALSFPTSVPRQENDTISFSRLVVFGDSYSDDGHGAWIASNETWPADPAYYGHHFSNGPVWGQDLSATWSLELLDYAAGGATADNNFVQGYTGYNSTIPVPSTNEQIANFLSNNTIEPTDIFTIYIGANDILFNTSITGQQMTQIIEGQVHSLYDQGAQTLLLATLPPISLLPADLSLNDSTKTTLDAFAQNVTVGLNEIATAWSPYINIAVADIWTLFTNIIADPDAYGVNASYVNPPTACLVGAYPGEGPRTLCDDPDTHLFFDTYHPTGRIHEFIARVFEDTLLVAVNGSSTQ